MAAACDVTPYLPASTAQAPKAPAVGHAQGAPLLACPSVAQTPILWGHRNALHRGAAAASPLTSRALEAVMPALPCCPSSRLVRERRGPQPQAPRSEYEPGRLPVRLQHSEKEAQTEARARPALWGHRSASCRGTDSAQPLVNPMVGLVTPAPPRSPSSLEARERWDRQRQVPRSESEPGRLPVRLQHSWKEVQTEAREPVGAARSARLPASRQDPGPAAPAGDREAHASPPPGAPVSPPVARPQRRSPAARWPRSAGPRARHAPA